MLAGLPARPGRPELRAPAAERAVPRDRRPRLGRRGGRGAAVRRRRGGRPAAEAAAVALLAPVLDERHRQGRAPPPARRGRAPAVLGPRADAGERRRPGRRVPRGDGRGRPGHDGDAAGPDLRARRGGVQPELAAAAAGDPVRQARSCRRARRRPKGQLSTDASVLEKLRDVAPDRRRDPVLARARQAELDVPGRAAQAGRSARRARPHDVQPDGRGDRAAVLDQPEPAEHPGPRRARPPDPSGVRPGFRRATCCSSPTTRRSSSGSWPTCPTTRD